MQKVFNEFKTAIVMKEGDDKKAKLKALKPQIKKLGFDKIM